MPSSVFIFLIERLNSDKVARTVTQLHQLFTQPQFEIRDSVGNNKCFDFGRGLKSDF